MPPPAGLPRPAWGAILVLALNSIRYIHNNPVVRGLVSEPAAWRWSSASWFTGGEPLIWMDLDPRRYRWRDAEPSESELAMWKRHLDLRGEELSVEE